jgi:hypothetical protein
MTDQEGLRSILDKIVDPILAAHGFKRTGMRWQRKRSDFVDVVEFQKEPGGTVTSEAFTINIGIFVPRINQLIWGKKERPRAAGCIVIARIGELLANNFEGKASDKWWEIEKTSTAKKAAEETQAALINTVLPFLEKYNNLTDIEQFLLRRTTWRSRYPLARLQQAVVQVQLGHVEEGAAVLREIAESNSGWSERARHVETVLFGHKSEGK